MNLVCSHLTVYNSDGRARLNDVSCTFKTGTLTLVIGQTGSGKSTLLDAASGLLLPDRGTVSVGDHPLWTGRRGRVRNPELAECFGMVFQQADEQLFAQTLEGEFRYNLRRLKVSRADIRQRAIRALADMGLPEDVLELSPFHLSGGQRRRAAIASTIAQQPDWWVLDEPTAGLDPQAIAHFTQWLSTLKQTVEGGIVIATHDLDALLPLADGVIILQAGRVTAHLHPAELIANPALLISSGVGLPSALSLASLYRETGVEIAVDGFTAEAAADAVYARLTGLPDSPGREPDVREFPASASLSRTVTDAEAFDTAPVAQPRVSSSRLRRVQALDPRSKWIAYLFLTISFISAHSWLGLALSAVVSVCCIALSGVAWQRIRTLVQPFLWFVLFSALFSGIRIVGSTHAWLRFTVGFSTSGIVFALHRVLPFLFVLAVGILLPETTSQLRMKQGLEQGLAWLTRVGLPIEALSLGTSLMLRFIPLISEQVTRFSRIALARGQKKYAKSRLGPKEFVVMAVPLTLALLKLGDDLSHAMEARGYRRLGLVRTHRLKLKLNKPDWLLVASSAVVLACYLFVVRRL